MCKAIDRILWEIMKVLKLFERLPIDRGTEATNRPRGNPARTEAVNPRVCERKSILIQHPPVCWYTLFRFAGIPYFSMDVLRDSGYRYPLYPTPVTRIPCPSIQYTDTPGNPYLTPYSKLGIFLLRVSRSRARNSGKDL